MVLSLPSVAHQSQSTVAEVLLSTELPKIADACVDFSLRRQQRRPVPQAPVCSGLPSEVNSAVVELERTTLVFQPLSALVVRLLWWKSTLQEFKVKCILSVAGEVSLKLGIIEVAPPEV